MKNSGLEVILLNDSYESMYGEKDEDRGRYTDAGYAWRLEAHV